MIRHLKIEANMTRTINGAAAHSSTLSDCLDLFATAGALRNASDEEVITRFMRAFAEDRDIALKTLFYARDIRGGLGERRLFRVLIRYLAQTYPVSVRKNIRHISEYGRYDDIMALIGTSCEQDAIDYIREVLEADIESLASGGRVSLMAKWLPSVNASNKDTVKTARKIAKALGMNDAEYRKMLSSLRASVRLIENNLRTGDYTFDYSKQPSRALFKYRQAFIRRDGARYREFIDRASAEPSIMHTSALTPYDIVNRILVSRSSLRRCIMSEEERRAVDVTWNALPDYVNSDDSLVVVDGSGSMYCGGGIMPAAVAQSLGIYFAERNKGAFANHFITFSSYPSLVEIKGDDIVDKVKYCMSYNACSNTDIERTFDLILDTAVKYGLKQSDMPGRLIIISDMEFDCCSHSDLTVFSNAKMKFRKRGYRLPHVVFWNVNSITRQQPVTMNEQGVILVSGISPQIFAMLTDDNLDPYTYMLSVVNSERYEKIAA